MEAKSKHRWCKLLHVSSCMPGRNGISMNTGKLVTCYLLANTFVRALDTVGFFAATVTEMAHVASAAIPNWTESGSKAGPHFVYPWNTPLQFRTHA
eukprot:2922841-Amphidinium_carterae.1